MKKQRLALFIGSAAAAVVTVAVLVYLFAFYLPDKREAEERERLVREYYENKYVLYREENERYAPFEVDVAFLGDSLTDGYDLAAYYPQYVTANRGIGGETSHGLEARMQVSLYDLKPKVAVILIGGNNLDTMMENYERMLIGVKETLPNTKVVLVSLTAMGGDYAKKNALAAYNNVIIKKLADKHGFAFVDVYTPLCDLEADEIAPAYTSDSVHLTARGYEVLTAAITPAIEAALGNN